MTDLPATPLDKLETKTAINADLIRLMRVAIDAGDDVLADKLMMFAAALGQGDADTLNRIARNPGLAPETASLPVRSMMELEAEYDAFTKRAEHVRLGFGMWLPGLNVRPLMPGEMMVILSDTGVGKTCLLQNIAINAKPLPTLMFQLELPGTLLFERYAQMLSGMAGEDVFRSYRKNESINLDYSKLSHIWTCARSGLCPDEIERVINESSRLIGKPPAVVLVDYIGLIRSRTGGSKRYERVSDAAEQLKVVAKNTDCIIIMASQVGRPENKELMVEPSLHNAKDSGSVENSAGLVVGAWRDPDDNQLLWLKILKNTKGKSGKKICCDFDVETMTITERGDSLSSGSDGGGR